MPEIKELEKAMPVAPLKLLALNSATSLGNSINRYLVSYRKVGKNVFYSLADDHVRDIIEKALEHIKE